MNIYVRAGGYWRVQPLNPHVTFESLWGQSMQAVYRRVQEFQDNEDFYLRNALPHELKFGLVGTSGTGKTAAVQAIANHLGRHIILLPHNEIANDGDDIWEILNPSHGKNEIVSKELLVSEFDLPKLSEAIVVFEGVDKLESKIQTRRQAGHTVANNDKARDKISQFLSVQYNKRVAVVTGHWTSVVPPGIDILSMCKPSRDDVIAKLDSFFGEGGGDIIRTKENWMPVFNYNVITNKIMTLGLEGVLSCGTDRRKLLRSTMDGRVQKIGLDTEPVIELDDETPDPEPGDVSPTRDEPVSEDTNSDGELVDYNFN